MGIMMEMYYTVINFYTNLLSSLIFGVRSPSTYILTQLATILTLYMFCKQELLKISKFQETI